MATMALSIADYVRYGMGLPHTVYFRNTQISLIRTVVPDTLYVVTFSDGRMANFAFHEVITVEYELKECER